MPRPRKINRPKALEIQLPEQVHGLVMAQLYSEVEGRVPFGAISALGEVLFTEWLRERGVEV